MNTRLRSSCQRALIGAALLAETRAALPKVRLVLCEACLRAPAEHWIWDSVHPTYSGHQLMADEWVRTVGQYYK